MLYIFDLDGTLLDTIADLGNACNYTLEKFGYPTHEINEYRQFVGNGVKKLIERALPENEQNIDTVMRLWNVFIPFYHAHNCEETRPYNGINSLLQTLRNNPDNKLAVASNKYHEGAVKIIEHYFPSVFDVILGERENVPRKPNPQIVFDIFEQARKQQAIYIGDSIVDIETAKNAGIPVAACLWGFSSKDKLSACQPDYLISSPEELLKIKIQ